MNFAKKLAKNLFSRIPVWSKFAKPALRVLLFHDVYDFEALDSLLVKIQGYGRFINPKEFSKLTFPLSENLFVLSFDDGYSSSARAIQLVDKKYGIKSLFFVATEWINCQNAQSKEEFVLNNLRIPNWREASPCSWSDLKKLSEQGHSIGSHSKTHRNLSELSLAELESEVLDSTIEIQRKIGCRVDFFANPFGDIQSLNANSLKTILASKLRLMTGIRGANLNPNQAVLFRQSLDLKDSESQNLNILFGAFDFSYRLDRQKLEHWLKEAK